MMRGLQTVRSVSLPVLRAAPLNSRSLHTRIARIPRLENVGEAGVALVRAPWGGGVPGSVSVVGLRRVLGRRYQSGAAAAV